VAGTTRAKHCCSEIMTEVTDSKQMIVLVEQYFAAVDAEDLEAVLATLAIECIFTVETHAIRLQGHQEISTMLKRLWANHQAVQHADFVHVVDPDQNQIATRFKVVNTEIDGSLTHKSNCNFFEVSGGTFSAVAVYMAGPNTLEARRD